MKNRDLELIKGLEKFRVLSRDDIIDLYFPNLKRPINSANTVLKRLVRDGQIQVSKEFTLFVYFPHNSIIKKDSTKIPHFLKIVDTYKQLRKNMTISEFIVEKKFSKGLAEPDIYTVINGIQTFIEIQRTIYTQKVMDEKMEMYRALYYAGKFEKFPAVLMITDVEYEINVDEFAVMQIQNIQEFIRNVKKDKDLRPSEGVRIKVAK